MAFLDLIAAADRAVQANLGGVVVTWQSDEWGDAMVPGMFDESYVRVDASEAGVEQVGPAFFCRLEDLPKRPTDDESQPRIVHGGLTYQIAERQEDGAGGVRLLLLRMDLDEDA